MGMDLLKRSLAPVVGEAWELIDQEATRVLKQNLAGRKLVDCKGPHGWAYAAVNTGRLRTLQDKPIEDVHVGLREVLPLMELRTPIVLSLMELDTVARGRENPDLEAVVQAAEKMAMAEDTAIFNGYEKAGMTGILPTSSHEPVPVERVVDWPRAILDAKERLRQAGITGPYAVALGTRDYDELFAATADGYPIAKQIHRQIIDGPIVHAPALREGVLLSARGGDYELVIGQDLSIGYALHDKDHVELYLTESFTFRVLEPSAAIRLRRS